MNETRVEKLRGAMAPAGLEAIVVTKIENVRYLSGFSGSSALAVVTPDRKSLVTDGRYREQASVETHGWEIDIYTGDALETVSSKLTGARSVGFEKTATCDFHERLTGALSGEVELVPTSNLVEDLRAVKDEGEVELIREAVGMAGRAFEEVLPFVRGGVSERELAAELDYRMVKAGADGRAFDTVVASGPNSSLPHAGITDRRLRDGDLLVVDFGAVRLGYNSDNTRTLVVGGPDRRQREVLDAVRSALDAAIETLRPGVQASDVDAAARACLERAGLAGAFVHSIGHGVGLEVHEKPALSSRSTDKLEPGMVFTVEPGVYIEGWGGVRLEEVVRMTGTVPEVLSSSIPF